MKGFFGAGALSTRAPLPLTPQCGACKLNRAGCKSPLMPTAGRGARGILVCGEAPGQAEDDRGLPFVGVTGQLLQTTLRKYGVELFRDCHVLNAVACRPPQNALPDRAVEYCRPNVVNAIKALKPEKILLFGAAPVKSVVGWLWKEDPGGVGRWAGWRVPCQRLNAWLCPFWHPSFVLREEGEKRGQTPVRLLWERQIAAALKLEGRPWTEVPDYGRMVHVVLDPDEAGRRVRELQLRGAGDTGTPLRPLAFDYETTTLKPDGPAARIVCCAVSDGTTAVAYPWHGDAVPATRELLRARVSKVGANAKFEERWGLKEFGRGVRNWIWDTVLVAHLLDNRSGVTGVKFQAFVQLGQESYEDAIKPLLKSADDNANTPNRITEVDLPALPKYCGTDAVVEWHVADRQRRQMGFESWGQVATILGLKT